MSSRRPACVHFQNGGLSKKIGSQKPIHCLVARQRFEKQRGHSKVTYKSDAGQLGDQAKSLDITLHLLGTEQANSCSISAQLSSRIRFRDEERSR